VIDGSCVLISPKILLTCAHNLYSYEEKTYYKELDYFPSRNGV
jgi:V8-like Glu-specific endopeptidase